jgi:PAS domain S-box-containing protein
LTGGDKGEGEGGYFQVKVLIVDDEIDICRYLQRELEKEGFEVEYTTSPEGVIERLYNAKREDKPYELLFLDLRMPKIGGYDLLKEVRKAQLDLDVIIITGYGDEDKAIEAIRLGAIDYLRKPISLEDLHTALFRVQQKKAMEVKKTLRHSILVVDDEKDLCDRIKRELDKEGYETAVAYDGVEGLEYFKNYRVDVVIADIRMPKMGGLEMLNRCREITDDFVSLIITGHGDHETAIEALKLGVSNYLKKPISLEELVVSVNKGIDLLLLRRGLSARRRELEIETALKEQYAKNLEKMVEERTKDLQRVSHALRALSSCNHALLHAIEESHLLHELCRIIVEICGYRMAWVGFAEQDEEKTVLPVAQMGYEEGYLKTMNMTWADIERGRGPTGTAIRTAKPCVCKNIPTDPDYAPWRNEAIKHGYASSISLPLIANGQTFGALNIYAAEPDAFDAEEVNLLMQMAGDLAYGIVAIRTRAEHKRAEEAIKESEHRFKAIFDNAADGILVADTENKKFFSGNRMLCQMFGYTEEEIKTLGVMDIHPEEDLPYVIDQFERQAKGEFTLASNIPVKRKDGSIFYADVNSFPIKLAGKTYLLGDFRDITERKQAEEALLKHGKELKKRVKELEEFYDMAVGRELRMRELKEEIESLKNELSRYKKVGGVKDD